MSSGQLDQVTAVADGILVSVGVQLEGELFTVLWWAAGICARRADPAAEAEGGQDQETTDANDEDKNARARPEVLANARTR